MSLWQSLKRQVAQALTTPLSALLGPRSGTSAGILLYHRIVDAPEDVSRPTWSVSPARFREQLAGLLARGYRPIALGDLLSRWERGEACPPQSFAVTFDDCYGNVATQALPILRELNVPATCFLATAFLDAPCPFPSDDWAETGSPSVPPETWLPMTRRQCRELQDSGLIELAAHTHTHADFRGRPDAFVADLRHCVAILAREFGVERPSFAFPYGTTKLGFAGGELSERARACGVACALSSDAMAIEPEMDPYYWGRFEADEEDSPETLAAKLNGWLSLARDAYRWMTLRPSLAPPARRYDLPFLSEGI